MALLSVQVQSALGTNTTTNTYSAADAQRYFSAWQNKVHAGGTQAQFVAWCAQALQNDLDKLVLYNETVSVVPPAVTVTAS